MTTHPKRPDVVAIYCPLWHNYDHASSRTFGRKPARRARTTRG